MCMHARWRCPTTQPTNLHHAVRSSVCLSPLRRFAPPCVLHFPPLPRCVPATGVRGGGMLCTAGVVGAARHADVYRCRRRMKASSLQCEAGGSAGERGDRADFDRRGKGAAVWGAWAVGTDGRGRHCATGRAAVCGLGPKGGRASGRRAGWGNPRQGNGIARYDVKGAFPSDDAVVCVSLTVGEGAGRGWGICVEPRRRDVETVLQLWRPKSAPRPGWWAANTSRADCGSRGGGGAGKAVGRQDVCVRVPDPRMC